MSIPVNILPSPTRSVTRFTTLSALNRALDNKVWNRITMAWLIQAREMRGVYRQSDYVIALQPNNTILVKYERDAVLRRIMQR